MTIQEYDSALTKRQATIKAAAASAWKEIQNSAKNTTQTAEERALKNNEAPCSVCGKTKFVLKYRDVSGSIHGETTGYFSLFGGSIHGYVDGETHTSPVLSCRNCENERRVQIAAYTGDWNVLEEQMPTLWGGYSKDSPATEWLNPQGLEVARELSQHLFLAKDYHDIRKFDDDTLIKVGLKYKYPLPEKPPFYWLCKTFL